jgi:hypothetical protein
MLSAGVKVSFCSHTRPSSPVEEDDDSGTPVDDVESSGEDVLGSPDSELVDGSLVGPVLVASVELVLGAVVPGPVLPASASPSSDPGQAVLNETNANKVAR